MTSRTRNGVIAFLLSILVIALVWRLLPHEQIQLPFDSQRWKSAPLYGTDYTRLHMVKNLTETHQLIGMTKEQVLDLLGPQSDPAYFKAYDLRYWLGPEGSGLALDSMWLVFKLTDNRVSEYRIVSD